MNELRVSRKAAGQDGGVHKELLLGALMVFLVLVVLGPLMTIGMVADPNQLDGEGTQLRQIAYILVAGVMAFSLRPVADYRRLLLIPMPLLIGLAWCILSLSWAIEPGVAFRRLVLTGLVMWTLFAGVRRLDYEESMTLFRMVLLLLLIANYVAVLVAPRYAIHLLNTPEEKGLIGDWRGIMQHKNFAGATCAITAIIFWFDADRFNKWVRWGVIAAALYFLERSGSKTSFGMGIAAVAAGTVYMQYNGRYKGWLLGLIAVAGIGVTMVSLLFWNPMNVDFADPKAFTGRPLIWKAMIGFISDHPMTGAGFGSFWNIGPTSPVYHYASGWTSRVATGHNGFLDLAAQLGIPGLLLIIAVAVVWPLMRLITQAPQAGARGAMVIALFLFCVGHNFTESSLFDRDEFVWITLMLAIALTENMTAVARRGFDPSRVRRVAA